MKKLLVLVLALGMLVAMASISMGAEISYTGGLTAEFNTVDYLNNGYGDVWMTVTYAKDFANGWTGGLVFDVQPGLAPATDNEVYYDGKGYIKYTTDMFDVALKTGLDIGVGSDLVSKGKLTDTPGVEFNCRLFEGFTATGVLGELNKEFNYLFKGVYAIDALTLGAGYSKVAIAPDDTNLPVDADTDPDAVNLTNMGVWGSYKLMDSLTVGAEFSSRDNAGTAVTGIQVKAGYTTDALTANVKFAQRDNGFYLNTDQEGDIYNLADRFWDNGTGKGYLITVDGTYKLNDQMTLGGVFNMTDLKLAGVDQDGNAVADKSMGYKLYVQDTLAENLVMEAGYQAFCGSKIYVKLTATL